MSYFKQVISKLIHIRCTKNRKEQKQSTTNNDNLDKTIKNLEKDYKLARRFSPKTTIGTFALKDAQRLAMLYESKGDITKSVEYLKETINIWKKIGHKEGEAQTLMYIGLLYSRNNPDVALEYYESAVKLFKEIINKRGEAETLKAIGCIFISKGEPEKGMRYLDDANKIFKEINSVHS